jgi:hypothetical protein
MKKTLLFLIILITFSCKKDESLSILNGNWELVNIYVYNYSSNDYTGDWSKLIMDFDGDTLTYNSLKGINFYDTTSYTYKKLLYKLKLEINDNVLVKCDLDDFESGIKKDTIFTTTYEEDDYDFTYGGGRKYDLRIEFGKNEFYILGLSDNVLYAIKDEIVNDTLILKNYQRDYQPSTYHADYKYIFHRVLD